MRLLSLLSTSSLAVSLGLAASIGHSGGRRPADRQIAFRFEPSANDNNARWSPLLSQRSSSPGAAPTAPANTTRPEGPFPVTWDKYSLQIGQQRLFLWSTEIHFVRAPVPGLWRDVLQRIKAAGFNAISIYTFWSLHQPSQDRPPTYGSEEKFLDVDLFLTIAKDVGLWVIVRPGPYINAETSGGGMPGWATRVPGITRTNTTAWTDAWTPYIKGLAPIIVKHQLTVDQAGKLGGGSVIAVQIENEYYNSSTTQPYFDQLNAAIKDAGLTVPTTFNDAGMHYNFVHDVDIYGVDSYPQNFDCSHPDVWAPVPTNYRSYHDSVYATHPSFIPEFQGGSFDPFGGPGYPMCEQLTDEHFTRVFDLNLWSQGVTMLSIYMGYGGTNWGGLAEPDVYTSYDYGSMIGENRILNNKHDEYKRQGYFHQFVPDFTQTDLVQEGDGVLGAPRGIYVTYLKNPNTSAGFYFVRHTNSSSTAVTGFSLSVSTSAGNMTVPRNGGQSTLYGRDSHVIQTDYKFGKAGHLLYSTASVLAGYTRDDIDVLVLHGDRGQSFETVLAGNITDVKQYNGSSSAITIKDDASSGQLVATWKPTDAGMAWVGLTNSGTKTLVLFVDTVSAGAISLPTILDSSSSSSSSSSSDPYAAFAPFHRTQPAAFVAGPYLVRNATAQGSTLALTGQTNSSGPIQIYAPSKYTKFTWNGQPIDMSSGGSGGGGGGVTPLGAYSGRLPGPSSQVLSLQPPKLTGWKYHDAIPEASRTYDDSHWVTANKTSTSNPFFYDPQINTTNVLFASEYGFHANNFLWRSRFNATGKELAFKLNIQGGRFFAASVWLNDVYLGHTNGSSTASGANATFTFPAGSVVANEQNFITILQDSSGIEEEKGTMAIGGSKNLPSNNTLEAFKQPRGIIAYTLVGADSKDALGEWKVAGNLDGEDYPDKTRGVYNEGGLYPDRAGWHLPGFDDSNWTARAPTEGLQAPGVGFFRTTFSLDLPDDHDVPISFVYSAKETSTLKAGEGYRALLYVNGWQFGKRIADLGPQYNFPVPPGILDTKGTNTVGLAFWGLSNSSLKLDSFELQFDGKFEGAVGPVVVDNPGWQQLRGGRSGPI